MPKGLLDAFRSTAARAFDTHRAVRTVMIAAIKADGEVTDAEIWLLRPAAGPILVPPYRPARNRLIARAWYLVIGAATISCTESTTSTAAPNGIIVNPSTLSLRVGGSASLSSHVVDSAGNAFNGTPIHWASQDPAVATIDQSGSVTGVAVGQAVLLATSGTFSTGVIATVSYPARDSGIATGTTSTILHVGASPRVEFAAGSVPAGTTILAAETASSQVAPTRAVGTTVTISITIPAGARSGGKLIDPGAGIPFALDLTTLPGTGAVDPSTLVGYVRDGSTPAGISYPVIPSTFFSMPGAGGGISATLQLTATAGSTPVIAQLGTVSASCTQSEFPDALRLMRLRSAVVTQSGVDPIVVILVHGWQFGQVSCADAQKFYYTSEPTWSGFVASTFPSTGGGVSPRLGQAEVWDYRYLTTSRFADAGADLSRLITANLAGRRVVILAHSKGGLVSASAMLNNTLIRGLVTAGTPWNGTPLATLPLALPSCGILYGVQFCATLSALRISAMDMDNFGSDIINLGANRNSLAGRVTAIGSSFGYSTHYPEPLASPTWLWDFYHVMNAVLLTPISGANDGLVPLSSSQPAGGFAILPTPLSGDDHSSYLSSTVDAMAQQEVLTTLDALLDKNAPVGTIAVPSSLSLTIGTSSSITAVVRDVTGVPLSSRTISYSSDNAALTVNSSTGALHANSIGVATVTATSEGQSASTTVTMSPLPTPADLIPMSVNVTPGSVALGGAIIVSYSVSNSGGLAAPQTQTKVLIKSALGTLVSAPTFVTVALAAGASNGESHTITLGGAPSGGYTVEVVVDNQNQAGQTNTSNDQSAPVSFSIGNQATAGATLMATPSAITAGGSSVLSWTSANALGCTGSWVGGTAVPLSGSLTVTPLTSVTHTIQCSGAGPNPSIATAAATITVTPVSAPSMVTGSPANVTPTGFRMTGSGNPNGVSTTGYFEWALNTALTSPATAGLGSLGSGTSSTPVLFDLTGLSCATTYYYRLIGTNGNGVTGRGAVVPATTSACPTLFLVTTGSSPAAGGMTAGGGSYLQGSVATVLATPAAGYSFVNWTVGGSPISTNASYTFTVSGATQLTANFQVNVAQYLITTTANPGGGGTTSGGNLFPLNAQAIVTAIPNSGFAFVNWTQQGVQVSTNPSYTFFVVGARDLVANFSLVNATSYQVTVWVSPFSPSTPSPGGTVSGAGSYVSGSQASLVASPAPGYRLANWMDLDGSINNAVVPNTFTFSVTIDRTVVANFESTDTTLGSLVVIVTGIPSYGAAAIAVAGPNGYSATVNQTGSLTGLTPGTYTLTPTLNLNFAGYTYNPSVQQANFTLGAHSTFYYSMAYH